MSQIQTLRSQQSKITKASKLTIKESTINSHLKTKLFRSEFRLSASAASRGRAIGIVGITRNVEFLESRKESILNSKYNNRKNTLVGITKENRKIYNRINSQKSNYSSRAGDKSLDSISSRASRLSQNSQRSRQGSSRANSKITTSKKILQKGKTQPLRIESINNLRCDQIQNFQTVFLKNSLPPKPPCKLKTDEVQGIQKKVKVISKIEERDEQNENPTDIMTAIKRKIKSQYTPERLNQPKKYPNKSHKSSVALPSIRQSTPQRQNKLSQIIDALGYRYRF